MAKQIGSTFIGTVDGLSCYYNRLHGYLVRQTGGVTSKEYHKDQRYEAARDNSKEFCVVSSTGKLIREALGEFLRPVKDGTMVNRLNKELVALKQQDRTHFRGERRPDVMMTNENANVHFRIFQFNDGVKLYDLTENYPAVGKPMHLKTTAFPEGATHAGLTVVRTVIDFATGTYRTVSSRMTVISKEGPKSRDRIHPVCPGMARASRSCRLPDLSSPGTEITCLQILFFKEHNGDLVQLRGKVHSMGILSVNQAHNGGCAIDRATVSTFPHTATKRLLNQVQAPIQNQQSPHPDAGASILLVPVPKRTLRRRHRRDYKRVLRGEDRHVYVQLHPSDRNERGYFVFRDGEKVFLS